MKQRFKSAGFFIELIITILFFAIACSIIVQIFAKAGLISREALDARNAATQAQTLCDTIKTTGNLEKIQGFEDGHFEKVSDVEYLFYWDDSFKNTEKTKAVFIANVKLEAEAKPYGQLLHINIKINKGDTVLYTMDGAQYVPKVGEAKDEEE